MSWRLKLLVVIVVLLGIVGAILWEFSRRAPSWYQPPDAADVEVRQLADRVESRMLEEVHRIREADRPWTLRVRQHQLNAWLATRLEEWMTHEGRGWPETVGIPQIRILEDRMELAVPFTREDEDRVVVVGIAPVVVNGQLQFELDRVGVGRVSLPGRAISDAIGELNDAFESAATGDTATAPWAAFFRGESQALPTMTLADDRTVRLMAVTCEEGVVDLTWRTE